MSNQLEYEKTEFINLVEAIRDLKEEEEKIFYRNPFRWKDEEDNVVNNGYESFSAESIAEMKGVEIVRKYGDHIFIAK
jgi:hypothetical protein